MIDPAAITLTDFLTTWYGPPSRDAAPLPPAAGWLPGPLREWHSLASRRDVPLTYMNSMIEPERIRPGDDGKVIFMVDATADWRWAFDVADPESVFDAELYEPWSRSSERLGRLLVHNAVRETVCGAPAGLRALDFPDEALPDLLAPVEEVAFGAWSWPGPGYRLFLSDDVLVEIVRYGMGWAVEVAAREPSALAGFERIPGTNWRVRHSGFPM